jgi:hypothetical protein
MTSYFSVVQLVPNPLADERVNIGVLAFDEERVECHFLRNWTRVKAFSNQDFKNVQAAVRGFQQGILAPDQIKVIAQEWTNAIQLTQPRASLEGVSSLLANMSQLMLVDNEPRQRRNSKATLVRDAFRSLEDAISERDDLGDGDVRVEVGSLVPGSLRPHTIDVSVQNGKVLHVAQAISFNRKTTSEIVKDVDVIAWVLKDIGESQASPPLSVLVAPPKDQKDPIFREATGLFRDLDANVVEGNSNSLNRWVDDLVGGLKAG